MEPVVDQELFMAAKLALNKRGGLTRQGKRWAKENAGNLRRAIRDDVDGMSPRELLVIWLLVDLLVRPRPLKKSRR